MRRLDNDLLVWFCAVSTQSCSLCKELIHGSYKTKKALDEIGHDIWEATQTNIGEDIDVFSSQKRRRTKKEK